MVRLKYVPGALHDPRFWGLFAVAVVCFSRGLAYAVTEAPEKLPYGLAELAELGSIKVYGVLWFGAAFIAVYLGIGHTNIWLVSLMTGMPTLWGLAYFLTWMASGFTSRDWITVVLYLCLSVIVVSFGIIHPQRLVKEDGSSG